MLFAYDGSDLAGFAIGQAARQLATGRDALVLCVWQPVDVGFVPVSERHFDADQATEVRKAAEETAEHGASLGTRGRVPGVGNDRPGRPDVEGIVETAEERQASLIVLGSHRHAASWDTFTATSPRPRSPRELLRIGGASAALNRELPPSGFEVGSGSSSPCS